MDFLKKVQKLKQAINLCQLILIKRLALWVNNALSILYEYLSAIEFIKQCLCLSKMLKYINNKFLWDSAVEFVWCDHRK